MILVRAPYRCSLFGGGTDYPAWYQEHGAYVIGFAMRKYCYIGVKTPPPGQGSKFRISYSKIEDCNYVDDIKHPAVRGVLNYLDINEPPVDVTYAGDLPSGGGIGASSSFVVALLKAMHALRGEAELDPATLADQATYIEREVIGEVVGDQDQLFAAYGGFRGFEIDTAGGVTPTRIAHPSSPVAEEFDACSVLVWTGISRFAHEMAAKVVDAIPDKTRDLTELQGIALQASYEFQYWTDSSMETIGALLNQTWYIKRRLYHGATVNDIDQLYLRAMSLGAWGGKLLGAGGGGFLYFVVPADAMLRFVGGIREAGAIAIPIKIAHEGCEIMVNE